MKKIINAKLINNENVEILIHGNKITKMARKVVEACPIIDAQGGYVMGGIVNSFFNGTIQDVERLISQGITSVFDFSFNDAVTNKLIEKGIKVFKAIGDNNGETLLSRDYLLKDVVKFQQMGVEDIILYVINPNLAEESNYTELINLASEYGYLLVTNVSETLEDVGEIDNQYSLSPIGLLESYGFLDHKHLLVGCVYADKEDVNILSSYDTNICICPTKDLKSGNGIAPAYSFIKNNINILVGGTTSNHFKEVSLVKDLQSGSLNEDNLISVEECHGMLSNNAHKLFDQIGKLKEGGYADIVIVDDFDVLNSTPLNVKKVIINGQLRYERI
jgi:cytosine/adenosine deaminase-related metal-dependent hydrolase